MKFSYKIHTSAGAVESGIIEAKDKFALSSQFKSQGAVLLSAVPVRESRFKLSLDIFSKITLREKILFYRNLAGMLEAGLSVSRALEILKKQTKNKKMQSVIDAISNHISSGGTLASGLGLYPKVFSSLSIAMVKAGEEAGALVSSLKEIASSMEKLYALNKKVKSAMMYPGIILSTIVLIGILMMMFVVPTITKTFKDLGLDLPITTKFIIGVSDLLAQHTLITFLGLIMFGGCVYMAIKIEKIKNFIALLSLKLPVIGVIVKEVNVARITRTLSSLLTSGVDMIRALEITEEVVSISSYKNMMKNARERIQKGELLSVVFIENKKIIPVGVGEMIAVGEETGQLSVMLLDTAIFYEGEVDAKTKDLSTIIEPVLMVIIGISVGFFAVSMLSPMYSLVEKLGN